MNKFVVGIIGLSLLLLIGGVVLVSSRDQAANITPETLEKELAISESDWVRGAENPKVTLVEYSDFQCPACGSYFPLINQAEDEFKENLRFVYRHYPIREIHQNAQLSAQAAEAAGKQGKFWEMHDKLFDFQSAWSESGNAKEMFIGYAQDMDLNVDQFKTDLDSSEAADNVQSDYQSGLRLGISSTPTFFLNGTRIKNPGSYEELKSLIQSAIDQS